MTHTFIVNDENVNEYGYRVLTDGIDTEQYERNPIVLYWHERARDPKQVVGRTVKLYKKNNQLFADIEFDEEDEYAKALAGKVERGFIKMCSLYADVIETSVDEDMVLPGQTLETVTKCKLVEISIVDIGGNDNALKLSRNGQPVQLRKIEHKSNTDMSLKIIALALGLEENASDALVQKEVNALKLAKESAESKVEALEKEIGEIRVEADEVLVDRAVALGLVQEEMKPATMKALEVDREAQTAVLNKMINTAEEDQKSTGNHKAVKEVVLGQKKGKNTPTSEDQDSFDYLQKHNVAMLRKIQQEEPDRYAKLAKEYAEGKRYTPNN